MIPRIILENNQSSLDIHLQQSFSDKSNHFVEKIAFAGMIRIVQF